MTGSVLDQLPTIRDVESELARNRQEAHFLRSIRDALRRREQQAAAAAHFRRQRERESSDGN
jgi:hypothetical protein